nr:hypothetical protein [Tanacetum cinerariifolium]
MAKSSSSSENEVEARLVEFKTQEIKFCEKIRGLEFDVEVINNKIENLMNELEQVKKKKEGLDSKLTGFASASKDLDTLLGSHKTNKNKEGLGYSDVLPPPAQVYSPPKKDISWTGLLEFADDNITDYSRPSPSIESNTSDLQNSNSSVSEHGESSSSIMSKPMIKFVKAADSPTVIKTNKVETAMKSSVNMLRIPTLRQYSRRATQIAQSKALSLAADEPASVLRDDSQGEAFPTVTSLDVRQDKENIIKTSALPYESTPRVTYLDADEGSMQQKLQELMEFCTGLQRQQAQMATKIEAQDLEISGLKERIRLLEDKDRGSAEPSGDDAPIKGTTVNILTSGVAAVSVPLVARVSTVGIPTVSGLVPTVSAIFTTASVVTPYLRCPKGISAKDKGKEKVVESEEPKKKKLQEQIDAQVDKEMEEEIARENQRMNE